MRDEWIKGKGEIMEKSMKVKIGIGQLAVVAVLLVLSGMDMRTEKAMGAGQKLPLPL